MAQVGPTIMIGNCRERTGAVTTFSPAMRPWVVPGRGYVVDMEDLKELSDHGIGRCMELRLEHRRDLSDPDDSLVQQWWATGVLVPTDGDGEPLEPEVPVVDVRLVRCQLGDPSLWMTLDGLEADLGAIGSVVLDPDTGDTAEDLIEFSGIGSHLLIVDSVVCDERFAKRQVGRWIAAEAIEAMSPGVEIVAAIAAPMDGSTGAARDRACDKLRDVWSSIGFERVSHEVMVLNSGLKSTHAHLVRLREKFGLSDDAWSD